MRVPYDSIPSPFRTSGLTLADDLGLGGGQGREILIDPQDIAGVADRPNSLRPNDNSSQQRARQMRDEADRIEEASKKAVSDAEQRVQEAQQAVEQFLAGHRSN